jgi:predicted alpha/beta hydrolase
LVAAELPAQEGLTASDGTRLCARHLAPSGVPWAAILIAPAMGVNARYYLPLATWLAEQGAAVLTFDFRGMGDSRTQPLRDTRADLHDWTQDQNAALEHLAGRWPGAPLLVLGQSLGAQLCAQLPARERIQGLLALSLGSGYVGHLQARFRWQARLFLHLAAPLGTALFGYFPGGRLGMVGDLPAGVMRHWRRWCLSPEYLLSAEGLHAQVRNSRFALISLFSRDDELLGEAGARMMFDAHGGARHFEVLTPRPGEKLGHLAIVHPRNAARWPLLLNHLREMT